MNLKRKIVWLLITSWLIIIPFSQTILGAGEGKTRTTTLTEYSTLTKTDFKEQTLIKTVVKTMTGPKVVETIFKTYTTVTTKKVVYSITYIWTTVTSKSKLDKTWVTIYYHSNVREEVPMTTRIPVKIRTSVTGLTTFSDDIVTTCLTDYRLIYSTRIDLRTITLTRIYETEYVEELDEGNSTQFTTILEDYRFLIVIAIIIAIIIFFVVIWSIRAHQRHIAAGKEDLVGKTAVVDIALEPKGVVLVEGERWTAITDRGRVDHEEEVIITKVEGLKLRVTKKE